MNFIDVIKALLASEMGEGETEVVRAIDETGTQELAQQEPLVEGLFQTECYSFYSQGESESLAAFTAIAEACHIEMTREESIQFAANLYGLMMSVRKGDAPTIYKQKVSGALLAPAIYEFCVMDGPDQKLIGTVCKQHGAASSIRTFDPDALMTKFVYTYPIAIANFIDDYSTVANFDKMKKVAAVA